LEHRGLLGSMVVRLADERVRMVPVKRTAHARPIRQSPSRYAARRCLHECGVPRARHPFGLTHPAPRSVADVPGTDTTAGSWRPETSLDWPEVNAAPGCTYALGMSPYLLDSTFS